MDPMPVFTIKAKDNFSLGTIAWYRNLCMEHGLVRQAGEVDKAYNEIRDWRERHPDQMKMPDHTHVPARSDSTLMAESDLYGAGPQPTYKDWRERALKAEQALARLSSDAAVHAAAKAIQEAEGGETVGETLRIVARLALKAALDAAQANPTEER
jgi:hypothetical protein